MAADLLRDLIAKPALHRQKQPPKRYAWVHSDFAVAGVAQRVERERDQSDGDDTE